MKCLLVLCVACAVPFAGRTQVREPQMPQAPGFQPVQMFDVMSGPLPAGLPMPDMNGNLQIGANASDIVRRQNAGNPYYGYNTADPRDVQRANEALIREQQRSDPAYNPGLRNGVRSPAPPSPQQELRALLAEAKALENPAQSLPRLKQWYYQSPEFAKESKGYRDALERLKAMLSGKAPLSVADAFYYTEAAYGQPYQSYKEFRASVTRSAQFVRQWMQHNHIDAHSPDEMHWALQTFMSQPLSVQQTKSVSLETGTHGTRTMHRPFGYDYNDYQGEKDFRSFFLTKAFATGYGQCSSLPAVYLSIAEALGVPAYLSLAPQHSFIKYRDSRGAMVNYEPTSNWKISDAWYADNMAITPEAKRSGIYLDTMNARQIVADQVAWLAFGFLKKFGAADGGFVGDCLDLAAGEFPRDNLRVRFVRSSLLARMLANVMADAGIRDYSQLARVPDALALYRALEVNEGAITALGYMPTPPGLYSEMLQQHEFKARVQDSAGVDGTKAHALFTQTTF